MKQLNWNVYTTSMVRVMKALLAAYVVTGLLLLAIAGFLYRFLWDEGKVQIGIIVLLYRGIFGREDDEEPEVLVGCVTWTFVFSGNDTGISGCKS